MPRPTESFRAPWVGLALALLGFAAATPPSEAAIVALDRSPVGLISPLPGAVLVAGSTTELAWRPLADGAALAGAEEWEAFLSLDGGRSFAVRLTPHLDLARRRVSIRVPALPSDAVRLLLRFGDEREERAVLLPAALRIVPAAAPSPPALPAFDAARSPGEPALPGAPGVLLWVDGNRDGSAWRERRAAPASEVFAPGPVFAAGGVDPLAADESGGPEFNAAVARGTHIAARARPAAPAAVPSAPHAAHDILLLLHRQNE